MEAYSHCRDLNKTRNELLRGVFGPARETQDLGHEVVLLGPDPFGCLPEIETRLRIYGRENKSRAVILLSPFGGLTPLDRWLAHTVVSRGGCVAAVQKISGDRDIDPAWDVHERGLVRGVAAIRRTLNWLTHQHFQNFSVFGSSMGALHAATAACLFEEISRMALIAAGAPIWKVAAESQHSNVRRMRMARLQREPKAIHHYEERLREALPLDLEQVAKPSPGRKDFLLLGLRDKLVPYSTQQNLVKLLQPEKKRELPFGHYGTIVTGQLFFRNEIARHLVGGA